MTAQEIIEMPSNKIRTISNKVGQYGSYAKFKVMKESVGIVIVTREGIMQYLGNAQYAFYSGKKGIHYKVFKTAEQASKFINS
jgi:hypothetical protein